MSNDTRTPAFPEGSMVRSRETGATYEVADGTRVAGWTKVVLPEVDDDGNRDSILPTDELELVEVGLNPNLTVPTGFTLTHMEDGFLDAKGPTRTQDDCTIECIWSSDKGHQFFFERRTDEPFTIDELDRLAELLKSIVTEYGSNGTA
ncbi:hypothetical protein [Citricoccus alkalitolerans]|uniref:Uncharacterized protein n=1 Tax=Citricoccus alkalitolerans TaxID=246603 RepID=A0ABV8XYA9_9MICC